MINKPTQIQNCFYQYELIKIFLCIHHPSTEPEGRGENCGPFGSGLWIPTHRHRLQLQERRRHRRRTPGILEERESQEGRLVYRYQGYICFNDNLLSKNKNNQTNH